MPYLFLKNLTQMARLFAQYLAIYGKTDYPNSIKVNKKWVQNFAKILNTLKNLLQITLPTCQGEKFKFRFPSMLVIEGNMDGLFEANL